MATIGLRIAAALIASLSLGVGEITAAKAVQLGDGSVAFAQPPRLEGASVTFNTAYAWGVWYYFRLNLLPDAGEPLQSVTITPDVNIDYARFNLSRTEAFEGTRDRAETRIPIKNVSVDPKTRGITVTFDPPVAPGQQVTVALYADRNPDTGGVYLYGVTAFPSGAQPRGQFLGYGRVNIYDRQYHFFSPFR